MPLAAYTAPAGVLDPRARQHARAFRGVIVTLVSQGSFGELQGCWDAAERYLLKPLGLTWMLVYERFPLDAEAEMRAFLQANALERVTLADPSGDSAAACIRYRAPSGVELLVRGVMMNVPAYLAESPQLLDRSEWFACERLKWSWNYVFYNTFFVYVRGDSARIIRWLHLCARAATE